LGRSLPCPYAYGEIPSSYPSFLCSFALINAAEFFAY
jgi:hypothetical protein